MDRRTDVWAFGCVLFECLSGRQAFVGETATDAIAKILEREPDWSLLPAAAPSGLRDLVRRCLAKIPEERPDDIGGLGHSLAALAMVWPLEAPPLDARRCGLFAEVRVESGVPIGSDVLADERRPRSTTDRER